MLIRGGMAGGGDADVDDVDAEAVVDVDVDCDVDVDGEDLVVGLICTLFISCANDDIAVRILVSIG